MILAEERALSDHEMVFVIMGDDLHNLLTSTINWVPQTVLGKGKGAFLRPFLQESLGFTAV